MPSQEKRVIYDFGSNNGDDIPYYLKKSDLVVAVEANPVLAEGIRARFLDEIEGGRLIVENCVLATGSVDVEVTFYINREEHVRSQFPKPSEDIIDEFDAIRLPSRNVLEVIAEHGQPFYVKIDLEGYDSQILKALFSNKIFPVFISAEAHNAETMAILLAFGRYKSFNIVPGSSVSRDYANIKIRSGNDLIAYSFPEHSAGPFGEDIGGKWMTPEVCFRRLALEGFGWKDVHATNDIEADYQYRVHSTSYVVSDLKLRFGDAIRSRLPKLYGLMRRIKHSGRAAFVNSRREPKAFH